jgi:hypothetical protein
VCFGRYRTVALDGCRTIKVPDTAASRGWLGKISIARLRRPLAGLRYPGPRTVG